MRCKKIKKKANLLAEGIMILLFLLFIIALFIEVGFLIYAYVNADSVECNLFWCTFTSGETISVKNSYSNITQSITTTSECFINDVKVNCSEINKKLAP